nr:hypothetical protein Iba_chr12aCG17630 [Ipomoea batatas]GMD64110.1 hypothetical protein Iba_chr12bCG21280 [Ipomoea batatas]
MLFPPPKAGKLFPPAPMFPIPMPPPTLPLKGVAPMPVCVFVAAGDFSGGLNCNCEKEERKRKVTDNAGTAGSGATSASAATETRHISYAAETPWHVISAAESRQVISSSGAHVANPHAAADAAVERSDADVTAGSHAAHDAAVGEAAVAHPAHAAEAAVGVVILLVFQAVCVFVAAGDFSGGLNCNREKEESDE